MPPKISLLKLTQTDAIKKLYENHHVIQDMLIPIRSLQESIRLFHEELEVTLTIMHLIIPVIINPRVLPYIYALLIGVSRVAMPIYFT